VGWAGGLPGATQGEVAVSDRPGALGGRGLHLRGSCHRPPREPTVDRHLRFPALDLRACRTCPLRPGGNREHPFNTPELGVGYALSSQHRGRGYATEAVKALIEYGFKELRVRRIVALTERGNVHSVNLMKRAGMRVGTNPHPEVVYPWAVGVIENRLEETDEGDEHI